VRLVVGTSGYSYKEWKGSFYPADLPASKMLAFYATFFESVEINNTFYRMPEAKTLAKWAAEVPDGFTFVLKAPQWITLQQKVEAKDDGVRKLFALAEALGDKLGPVLFRWPPHLGKDVDRLRDFLRRIPNDRRAVLELREPSWEDEEVYAALREHDVAFCVSDTDEVADPDKLLVSTASWGYVRLRRTEYGDDALAAWRRRIEAQPWTAAYVFFKHEDEGKGPAFAERFLAAA
jgi:uncharacterized protein YecE (DUF72 family)